MSTRVRRRIDDPTLENMAVLVTPFAAFLLADLVHASGVLAVVVCGLLMSQTAPRITSASARQQMVGFWTLATTVLSSALFLLVGLQAQSAVRNLTSTSFSHALVDIVVVTAAVIGTRWAWLYTTPYLIRLVDRRESQRARRIGARQRVVTATAGFRGAVSLALALAVPTQLASGAPFPDRDLIVVVTCGVIVLTLLQALLLPPVVQMGAAAGRLVRRRGATSGRGRHGRLGLRGARRHCPSARHRRPGGRPRTPRVRQAAQAARGGRVG